MKRWIAVALLLCILCTGCDLCRLPADFRIARGFSGSYAGLYQVAMLEKACMMTTKKIADESENLSTLRSSWYNINPIPKKSAVEIRFAKFHGKQQCFCCEYRR